MDRADTYRPCPENTSETDHDQKPLATNKVLQRPSGGCRSMNGRWCGCGCDFCRSDKLRLVKIVRFCWCLDERLLRLRCSGSEPEQRVNTQTIQMSWHCRDIHMRMRERENRNDGQMATFSQWCTSDRSPEQSCWSSERATEHQTERSSVRAV